MRFLLDKPFAAFDIESTGVDVETDHVITATAALLRPGQPQWSVSVKTWLADPGVEIPKGASDIHGITTEHAREHGRPLADVLNEVADALAGLIQAKFPVVVMNGSYDFTLLDRNLRRYDLPTVPERSGVPISPVVDVYVLDKHVDPYRKSGLNGRRLTGLCETYGVRLDGAHDSTADALGAARVAYRLALLSGASREELVKRYSARRKPGEVADEFRALNAMDAAKLHTAQIAWRAEQQASLAEWLRDKGEKADDVNGEWPMHLWRGGP